MTNVTDPRTNVIPLDDTREKLEMDVWKLAEEWRKDNSFWQIYSSVGYAEIIDLLDRQDAITQRDCIDRWDAKATLEIVGLQAKVDELTAELEEARKRHMENEDKLAEENDALIAKVDELTEERDRARAEAKTQRNNFDAATKAREHWKKQVETLTSCLAKDHGLNASWDGLRGFWNIEITEEHMNARDALAAELADIERTHMRLPVDADGVPIRIGDYMALGDSRGEVKALSYAPYNELPWQMQLDDYEWYVTVNARHVTPDTVESLLEEYAQDKSEDWRIACDRYFREHCWSKDWLQDPEFSVVHCDNIAEYAERIRKAVEHG